MAVSFETAATTPSRRGEFFFVHPDDVHVDATNASRGRKYNPTPEQVAALAANMADPAIGQQNAIVCRKGADKKLYVVSGYTRLDAAKLIVQIDPEFRLKVTVITCSEKEAALRNIAENAMRSQTSVIDDAHNQRRLMEVYGLAPEEVRTLYQYTGTKKIGRLARLLELPERAQLLVHSDLLTTESALNILDIPTAEGQREALKEVYAATNDGKKIKGSKVLNHIRELMADDDDADEAEPNGEEEAVATPEKPAKTVTKSRRMVDINSFLSELSTEAQPEQFQKFATAMSTWIKGKKTNRWLVSQLREVMSIEE